MLYGVVSGIVTLFIVYQAALIDKGESSLLAHIWAIPIFLLLCFIGYRRGLVQVVSSPLRQIRSLRVMFGGRFLQPEWKIWIDGKSTDL